MRGREIKELARDYGVQQKTVRQLLKMGVPEEDIQDVLDFKELLGEFSGEYPGQVSVELVSQAYQAARGDLGVLGSLGDKALERAGEIFSEMWVRGEEQREIAQRYTLALRQVLQEYQKRGESYLEE